MNDQTPITFSNNWFDLSARPVWDRLIPQLSLECVLEIGSFEGASACYLIERAKSDLELHCIDTWEGNAEHRHRGIDMSAVEARFHANITQAADRCPHHVTVIPYKGRSHVELARMIAAGRQCEFDLIYIDGSHFAPDVITDAVLSFPLLKVGGHLVFDDYLWRGQVGAHDLLNGPKLGIDAFLNLFYHKMLPAFALSSQAVAKKISE